MRSSDLHNTSQMSENQVMAILEQSDYILTYLQNINTTSPQDTPAKLAMRAGNASKSLRRQRLPSAVLEDAQLRALASPASFAAVAEQSEASATPRTLRQRVTCGDAARIARAHAA